MRDIGPCKTIASADLNPPHPLYKRGRLERSMCFEAFMRGDKGGLRLPEDMLLNMNITSADLNPPHPLYERGRLRAKRSIHVKRARGGLGKTDLRMELNNNVSF